MMNKSKLTLIAALVVASVASPAFAQSFEHTGSVLPHYYDASGVMVWGSWGPPQATATTDHRVATNHRVARSASGASAFAAVPLTTRSDPNPNSRTLTGGGSLGYNQNLYNY